MDGLDDFRTAIVELISEFGGMVSYYHTLPNGVYDPEQGQVVATVVQYDVKAIVMDMPLHRNGMQVKAGTMIQDGDKQMFLIPTQGMLDALQVAGIDNIAADRVQAAGASWRVYNVKSVDPAQTGPIVFEFYLRR